MLIRLLILSAFVLLVHLVVGMFARDLMHLQMHELTKRAAKDDGTDAALNIMSRRRQLVMQQRTMKRAVSPKTTRRQRDSDEELLHAEETSYSGALVKDGVENSTLSSNESKVVSVPPTNVSVTRGAKDDYTVDSSTESKETSITSVARKRRPVQRATESYVVSSHLPVPAALTMSESLYNHFRPLDREVPEDQFLPFLQFGKKLVPNAKTTFPATVTSSTNALDSVTNSPRVREFSSFHPPVETVYQASVTRPRLSEEEVNEDMDVAVVKPIIEKNKATRGKASSLLSLRNVGGLYRKQLETNENLVISSDKNLINDTGAKVNDTKDIERKRVLSVTPGMKEVIIDSNGRRKIVAVSRRPLLTNITSAVTITTTTAPTTPLTNTSNDKAEVRLLVNPLSLADLSATSTSTTSTTSHPITNSTSTAITITSSSTTTTTIPTIYTTTSPSIRSDNTASPVPTSISRTSTVTRAATTSTTVNHSSSTSPTSPSIDITTEQPTITSTTSTTPISPLTNATSTNNTEHPLAHDPTQFSSSNVVAARTVPHRQFSRNSTTLSSRRKTSGLYSTERRTNPLRTSLLRQTSDNTTELDMTPEESNASSSFGSSTNNSTLEDIKNQASTRQPSIIEKYQQMRMADVRAGRRQLRQNYTDILRNKHLHSVESDGVFLDDSQRTNKNTSESMELATKVSVITTVTPSLNLSSSSDVVVDGDIFNFSTSSERPTTTSSLLIPTTKILSTAVVTSVSIKGAWPSGVTEMPSQEVFPVPPQERDSTILVPDEKESEIRAEKDVSNTRPENFADEKLNLTEVNPTAPGNATYSMIKELLAGMNASEAQTDTQSASIGDTFKSVTNGSGTEIRINNTAGSVREVLPLSHEHFVGVDSPRPVFTNSSVVYTTSYSRKESPQIQRSPPFLPTLENVNATSLPRSSTTTSTTTTGSPVPHITVAPLSSPTIPLSQSTSPAIEVSLSTSSSPQSPPPNVEIAPVNTSIYQQDDPSFSSVTEQNLSKGRALWSNTTSRPSTNIPVVQSSDKDFHLPLVKLYNASTVWGDAVHPTEEASYNEAPYETVSKVDEEYVVSNNQTGKIFNDTSVNVNECNGSEGCYEDERHTSTTRHPLITKDCEGLNSTQEGCIYRPRESSVSVAESSSTLEIVIYVLAGICIIPAVVGALFLVRCVLRHRRKVLDESDTCSEISCHRAGENGEATTPASTKLPRLQPHMGWEQEKSPTSPPAVSDTNNRWEFPRSMLRLQTVLGQGNFGQVLKAEADDLSGHPGTTRLVAVKLVKEGATTREKEDLLRELEIMKQLGAHPNVVTLLGCCTEQEPYLLIMEYVMYGKLLTFLRDHRTRQNYYNFSEDSDALTSRDLTVFGYCVARGMEYLVSKGIIHRDLAARNVLVDHNKLCKIADFGMSRSVRELGEIYEQRQTKGALPIRWMAPESLLYRVFTHKSDVWSFGIVMWEIVTLGSTPYPTMGAREVMKRVREGYRLERPSHCRPELFRVISHCWNSDPAKRPDFSELKRELGSLVEDAREGKYVDLDRFAEYSGGRTTTLHSGGEPELIHM
ncbi:uncharacterized protein [Anabrus simplex]|uniref:uncharacterized protein n=1 Tax=Anabrus simplex TaxID=316456 RepID=UPI0035A3A933